MRVASDRGEQGRESVSQFDVVTRARMTSVIHFRNSIDTQQTHKL